MTGSPGAEPGPSAAYSRLRVGVGPAGETTPGHAYLPALGWFRVYRRGDRLGMPPAGLSRRAQRRRRLAERLADTMALLPDEIRGWGHDVESATRVYVPVEASELAQRVIADAEAVTEAVMGAPSETRVYDPGDGVVVLVHGPDWSLIFEITSVDTVIRICADELGEYALAVDEDPDPAVRSRLLAMTYDVLFQLQRLSIGGDLYQP